MRWKTKEELDRHYNEVFDCELADIPDGLSSGARDCYDRDLARVLNPNMVELTVQFPEGFPRAALKEFWELIEHPIGEALVELQNKYGPVVEAFDGSGEPLGSL